MPNNNSHPQRPVAYDRDGNPLYAHPPQPQAPASGPVSMDQHQVMHWTRPIEPRKPQISDAMLQRHKDSKAHYPRLNLSEGEYVISAIRRHPIGLFSIWAVSGSAALVFLLGIPFIFGLGDSSIGLVADASSQTWLGLILLMLSCLFFLGGVIATVVYQANRFFLTNESVIQHIQFSLFSKKEQTISLANVEDASFRQHGILQHLLSYGSIRLSTEGDETTYRFNYVSNPHKQVMLLNNAVEAFKNGRPVGEDD